MKKVLSIAAMLLMFSATALAAIENVQESYNLKLNFPVVTLVDQDAQEEINTYIGKKIKDYKKDFSAHNYAEASVDYAVKYEDDNYLSLTFTYWWYYPRAAHGMYDTTGVVFDKHTGKAVPLKCFAKALSAKKLDTQIRSGELQLLDTNLQPIGLQDFWRVEHVSSDYYLDADKNVYLIYQPYELAAYVHGNTYIKLPADFLQPPYVKSL